MPDDDTGLRSINHALIKVLPPALVTSQKAGAGGWTGVCLGGTVMPWENEFRYWTLLRKRELLW
jgi:hypothetical protein